MKKLAIIIGFAGLIGILMSAIIAHNVQAQSVEGFQAGRIIDDSVFTNSGSMTPAQIQSFLNSKVAACDTSGTQSSEFGGGTRAQYGASKGNPAPFICLKDYSEAGRSAAQIIYDTAQEFTINPQVLLVLLQKEQGLVTDTWPFNVQYRTATGYGCPDTAPCDTQYFGLTNQVRWASRMFRAIMNASPTWYTPYVVGNNFIQYNPTSSCGGTNVTIQNRATQALYNYTPYQPNPGALASGWGTSPCGAYGNRNFYLYFKSWFGNTLGQDHSVYVKPIEAFKDAAMTTRIPSQGDTFIVQPGQEIYLRLNLLNDGRSTWNTETLIGTAGPTGRESSFYNNSWISSQRTSLVAPNREIAPYETAVVTLKLKAPTTTKQYAEQFDIVQERVKWFDKIFTVNFQVSEPSTQTKSESASSLLAGQKITVGQSLNSIDSYSILRLTESGTAELYVNFKKVWNTPAAGKDGYLVLQTDGNLVLYTSTGAPVWDSGTGGNTNSNAHLQADGNFVIYRANGVHSWQSNTSIGISHTEFPTNEVSPGGKMFKGQAIESLDRKYSLQFQGDGNLVLYGSNDLPVWNSGTFNTQAQYVVMQTDGNLVIYDPSNKPLWNSQSSGKGSSRLVVQSDRNLVIYNPTTYSWASHTGR